MSERTKQLEKQIQELERSERLLRDIYLEFEFGSAGLPDDLNRRLRVYFNFDDPE